MQEFQQRVVDEKRDLDERRERLVAFIGTTRFKSLPPAERCRLNRQAHVMGLYSQILADRVSAFTHGGQEAS